MKVAFPRFEPVIEDQKDPLQKIIAITWNTIVPIALTFIALKTDNVFWAIPIIITLLVRIPEE